MTKIHKTTAADLAAAKKAAWRRRCIEAMDKFTDETLRLLRQHAVTVARDEGTAG